MKKTIYINEAMFNELTKPKKKSHLNPDKWYEDKADFSISSSEGDLGYAHVVGDAGCGGDAAAGGVMCEGESGNYLMKVYRGYKKKYGSRRDYLLWVTDDAGYAKGLGDTIDEMIIDTGLLVGFDDMEYYGYEFSSTEGPSEEECENFINDGIYGYEFETPEGPLAICLFSNKPILKIRTLSDVEYSRIPIHEYFAESVILNESMHDTDLHKYIESYLDFLERNDYKINPRPAIELNAEEQDGMNIRTGYYDPDERKVVVFINGRHIKDILRSFAHEMVHHMQNLRDEHMDWGHGGDLVDDDKLRELEGEAYHVGNVLFREWTEELKKNGKINESKKIIKNDKGEVVPEKCDKCGGKVVCQIHGEPVYVCKDCGKYFGTMPFTLKESINWVEKLKSLKARRDPDSIENWDELNEATESDVDLSSFKIQNELNPKIWVNGLMDSRVRLKLMDIAQDFIEFLDVTWVKPEDTIVVGSIANYNWSRYSDIDLHIVIDYSKVDDRKKFVENYFQSKKKEWNDTHDEINIFGHPVELYVQDKDADNASSAVYSLDKNKWIKKPEKSTFTKKDIDSQTIKKKASSIMTDIENLEKKGSAADGNEYKNRKVFDDTTDLIDDITLKRKTSLSKTKDEMNTDNLVFKVLRRNGYLDKLFNLRDKTYDKMNSIE